MDNCISKWQYNGERARVASGRRQCSASKHYTTSAAALLYLIMHCAAAVRDQYSAATRGAPANNSSGAVRIDTAPIGAVQSREDMPDTAPHLEVLSSGGPK